MGRLLGMIPNAWQVVKGWIPGWAGTAAKGAGAAAVAVGGTDLAVNGSKGPVGGAIHNIYEGITTPAVTAETTAGWNGLYQTLIELGKMIAVLFGGEVSGVSKWLIDSGRRGLGLPEVADDAKIVGGQVTGTGIDGKPVVSETTHLGAAFNTAALGLGAVGTVVTPTLATGAYGLAVATPGVSGLVAGAETLMQTGGYALSGEWKKAAMSLVGGGTKTVAAFFAGGLGYAAGTAVEEGVNATLEVAGADSWAPKTWKSQKVADLTQYLREHWTSATTPSEEPEATAAPRMVASATGPVLGLGN